MASSLTLIKELRIEVNKAIEQCNEYKEKDTVFEAILSKCEALIDVLKSLEETANGIFKIIAVGNISLGKSSVLNAMTERDILKYHGIHTTKCFVRISKSDRNAVESSFATTPCADDKENKSTITRHMKKLVKDSKHSNDEITTFIDTDSSILRENVWLYDSPGLEGDVATLDLIKKKCKEMDVIIILLNYNLQVAEKKNYSDLATEIIKMPILILINKWDETDENDDDDNFEAVRSTKDEMENFIHATFDPVDKFDKGNEQEEDQRHFYISAKEAMQYKLKEPNGPKQQWRYAEFQRFKSRLSIMIKNVKDVKIKRLEDASAKLRKRFDRLKQQLKLSIEAIRRDQLLLPLDNELNMLRGQFTDISKEIENTMPIISEVRHKRDIIAKILNACRNYQDVCSNLKGPLSKINIAFIGGASVGKSSSIAVLLKKKILFAPTNPNNVFCIRLSMSGENRIKSPNNEAVIQGDETAIRDQLAKYTRSHSSDNGTISNLIQIELNINNGILMKNVNIWDTPGSEYPLVTKQRCKDMDIVVLVIDYQKDIADIENQCIEHFRHFPMNMTIILINKGDGLDNDATFEDIKAMKTEIVNHIRAIIGSQEDIRIIFISAKEQMDHHKNDELKGIKGIRHTQFKLFKQTLQKLINTCTDRKQKQFEIDYTDINFNITNTSYTGYVYTSKKELMRMRKICEANVESLKKLSEECSQCPKEKMHTFEQYSTTCVRLLSRLKVLKKTINKDINIICLGEISAGKSYLINGLLSMKLLKSSSGHTSRCFVIISKGANNTVSIPPEIEKVCDDGNEISKVIDEYNDRLISDNVTLDKEVLVNIAIENPILKDNVHICDSPGFNTPDVRELISKRCTGIDVIILVLQHTLPTEVQDFLKEISTRMACIPIFVVLNKYDKSQDPDGNDKDNMIIELKKSIKDIFVAEFQNDMTKFYEVPSTRGIDLHNNINAIHEDLINMVDNFPAMKLKRHEFNRIKIETIMDGLREDVAQSNSEYNDFLEPIRANLQGINERSRILADDLKSHRANLDAEIKSLNVNNVDTFFDAVTKIENDYMELYNRVNDISKEMVGVLPVNSEDQRKFQIILAIWKKDMDWMTQIAKDRKGNHYYQTFENEEGKLQNRLYGPIYGGAIIANKLYMFFTKLEIKYYSELYKNECCDAYDKLISSFTNANIDKITEKIIKIIDECYPFK